MAWPPRELREAARRVVLACPDCAGVVTVHPGRHKDACWVVDIRHLATCPTQRTARSRRAAERDLTDALAAVLHLGDYAVHGDLITTRHRLAGIS